MTTRKPKPEAVPEPEPEDRTQAVIRMYQEGHKLADITAATGVPRATIYFLLDREGIPTNRLNKDSGKVVSASEILDRLRQTERENGMLREKVQRLEALVEYLGANQHNGGDGHTRARVTKRGAD